MAYIASSKIMVFPSTKRGNKQVSARLFSEENVSNIINKLLDKDSFVITTENAYGLNNPFEFNIHGYYFKADKATSIIETLPQNTTSIYANIIINTVGNYTELVGQDDETIDPETGTVTASEYQGIQFSAGSPITSETGTVHSLLILSRTSTSSNFTVPNASRFKFTRDSLEFDVDGGQI